MNSLINIFCFPFINIKKTNKICSLYIIRIKLKNSFEFIVNDWNIKRFQSDWMHIKTEWYQLVKWWSLKTNKVKVIFKKIYNKYKIYIDTHHTRMLQGSLNKYVLRDTIVLNKVNMLHIVNFLKIMQYNKFTVLKSAWSQCYDKILVVNDFSNHIK